MTVKQLKERLAKVPNGLKVYFEEPMELTLVECVRIEIEEDEQYAVISR